MSKYNGLTNFLIKKGDKIGQTIHLSFEEIEAAIDAGLPSSAYSHRQWWANQVDNKSRAQARAWMEAGFEVESVNFNNRLVSFRRVRK